MKMMNKTYSVREIHLNDKEVERAIQEYIEKHNSPTTVFPANNTIEYNLYPVPSRETRVHGILVTLIFGEAPE